MFSRALDFLDLGVIDIIDMLSIALIIFLVFRWLRGSSALNIFIAIAILLVLRIVVAAIGMKMTESLLGTVIDVGAVALIVIFQPEIRRFLGNIGRTAGDTIERRGRGSFLDKLLSRKEDKTLEAESVKEIAEACKEMAEQKTGALIVILHRNVPEDVISTGDRLDARISRRLIMNLFFDNSPLHDGAVIIGDNRIIAARCTLPMSDNRNIPAKYGMRHKSALGLSEQSDADIIVISEQRGTISFVREGQIKEISSINALKLLIGSGENNSL